MLILITSFNLSYKKVWQARELIHGSMYQQINKKIDNALVCFVLVLSMMLFPKEFNIGLISTLKPAPPQLLLKNKIFKRIEFQKYKFV